MPNSFILIISLATLFAILLLAVLMWKVAKAVRDMNTALLERFDHVDRNIAYLRGVQVNINARSDNIEKRIEKLEGKYKKIVKR